MGIRIHGMCGSRFYGIFNEIKSRCRRYKDKNYNNYGGRGIEVEWVNFNEFRDDMYNSYLKHREMFGARNTSIDRIDNNGNYSKENCQWATIQVQNNNKRSNNRITFNGETKTVAEWSRELGIKRPTLSKRLNRMKYPIEKALVSGIYRTNGEKYENK
jgi:hypothetical protein